MHASPFQAVPWLRRGVTAEARVRSRVSPRGISQDKVVLTQVFLRVLRFSPVSMIPPVLHTHLQKGKRGKTRNQQNATLSCEFYNRKLLSDRSVGRHSTPHHTVPAITSRFCYHKQTNQLSQTQGHNDISYSVFAGARYQSAQCCRIVQPTRHFQRDASHNGSTRVLHKEYSAILTAFLCLRCTQFCVTVTICSWCNVCQCLRPIVCCLALVTPYGECCTSETSFVVVGNSAAGEIRTVVWCVGWCHRCGGSYWLCIVCVCLSAQWKCKFLIHAGCHAAIKHCVRTHNTIN
jgi:hypothetical protein